MSVLRRHHQMTRIGPSTRRHATRHRAAALVAVVASIAALMAAVTPLVGPVAALDPTAGASPAPSEVVATTTPAASPDPSAPGTAPAPDPTPSSTPEPEKLPLFPLILPVREPVGAPPRIQNGPNPFVSPHDAVSLVADTCAACHRSHDAPGEFITADPAPAVGLCFTCHDGTGAMTDIAARYADPGLPANDPGNSAWYSHPALATDTGARSPVCTACHQPHRAEPGTSTATGTGWTISGANLGASGVVVTNGGPGDPPTYTPTDDPSREYQLCLKCHSGFADLPGPDPAHPSRWALDKGIEFNPANASTHPVEGPGSNATAAMAASLAGGLLWQFEVGDTIRCTNCHGDPTEAVAGTDPGDRLAPHTSEYRGLLIAPYRDRDLTPVGVGYVGADFTLCWLCHAEGPFIGADGGESATNFPYHELHVTGIEGEGSGGLDIDTAGAGQGNAICAECHFRLHSTALAVNPDDRDNARLVNFAPNVEAFGGVLEWAGGAGGGSCTLVCHGYSHDAKDY